MTAAHDLGTTVAQLLVQEQGAARVVGEQRRQRAVGPPQHHLLRQRLRVEGDPRPLQRPGQLDRLPHEDHRLHLRRLDHAARGPLAGPTARTSANQPTIGKLMPRGSSREAVNRSGVLTRIVIPIISESSRLT